LVAGALAVDNSVASITNAAVSILVPVTVERTDPGGSALTIDNLLIVAVTNAFSIDVGGS